MSTHHTHHDPATRALIAQAEQRGAARALWAVERLADEYDADAAHEGYGGEPWSTTAERLRALLERESYWADMTQIIARTDASEHHDEHPAPELASDVTEDELAEPHVVHVTAEPVAEDAVWCDECEEWVTSGAPEPPSDVTEDDGPRLTQQEESLIRWHLDAHRENPEGAYAGTLIENVKVMIARRATPEPPPDVVEHVRHCSANTCCLAQHHAQRAGR